MGQTGRLIQEEFQFPKESERSISTDFTFVAEAFCLPDLEWKEPYRELQASCLCIMCMFEAEARSDTQHHAVGAGGGQRRQRD